MLITAIYSISVKQSIGTFIILHETSFVIIFVTFFDLSTLKFVIENAII